MSKMPTVDINAINDNIDSLNLSPDTRDEYIEIVKRITKKNGEIRASKLKVKDDIDGKAAYVWRMVAFSVSKNPQHHCMPVCADFDLPAMVNGRWDSAAARAMATELNVLEKTIVNSIPKSEWHGISRWGRALGRL